MHSATIYATSDSIISTGFEHSYSVYDANKKKKKKGHNFNKEKAIRKKEETSPKLNAVMRACCVKILIQKISQG